MAEFTFILPSEIPIKIFRAELQENKLNMKISEECLIEFGQLAERARMLDQILELGHVDKLLIQRRAATI